MSAAVFVVVYFATTIVDVEPVLTAYDCAGTILALACAVGDIAIISVLSTVVIAVFFAGAIIDVIASFAFCGFTDTRITDDLNAVTYLGWDARISVFAAVFVVVFFETETI